MKNAFFVPLFALFLSGCIHYMPGAVSSTSIGSTYEIPVKTVTGTSSAEYLFGFRQTGDDSLNAAIENAKSQAPSDSIANIFVDRKITCIPFCCLPIYKKVDTYIYGTLVKYTKGEDAPVVSQYSKTRGPAEEISPLPLPEK